MMRIPLINTDGQYAVVDNVWYPMLAQWRWRLGSRRYAETSIHGKTTAMHNLVLPPEPGFVTDHRNGMPLDNRLANLRRALPHQNAMNRTKRVGASSTFHGVWKRKQGRFYLTVASDALRLGPYDSEVEAAITHDVAAFMLCDDFAPLNFPDLFPPTGR